MAGDMVLMSKGQALDALDASIAELANVMKDFQQATDKLVANTSSLAATTAQIQSSMTEIRQSLTKLECNALLSATTNLFMAPLSEMPQAERQTLHLFPHASSSKSDEDNGGAELAEKAKETVKLSSIDNSDGFDVVPKPKGLQLSQCVGVNQECYMATNMFLMPKSSTVNQIST